MTVVVWDGTTLAADRRATNCGLVFSVSKLARVNDCLVGVSGLFSRAGEYLAWLAAGRDPTTYPKQGDNDLYMLVIHPSGRIERFEQSGWPVVVEESKFACGSGRDFAMAALALGCDARRAVEITCQLSSECGNGIDTLTFERAAGFIESE